MSTFRKVLAAEALRVSTSPVPDVVLPSLLKSKNDLDWEPKTNIEDGIKSTIDWYSSFQDKIRDFTYIN